jgi:hypothetical protein
MGFLDRLLGREQPPADRPGYGRPPQAERPEYGSFESSGRPRSTTPSPGEGGDSDAAAIERYRYLLRTAPPDAVEQAHREAFSQLTPEQRRQVLLQLGSQVPESERATSDDPKSLARMATRAEMRRPGTLERSLGGGRGGGMGGGIGMGGLIAGSLLSSVAGAFIGTAIADAMFDNSDSENSDSADGEGDGGDGGDGGDAGDAQALDGGGGYDSGGDFGGSDFGDFGGGDF